MRFFLGHLDVALDHPTLDIHSAMHGVHHTRKLHQHAVTRGLDDAATVLSDQRIDQGPPMGLERRKCAFLVQAHKTAIARHVGCKDGRKASVGTFLGHVITLSAWMSKDESIWIQRVSLWSSGSMNTA